jgi:hypothetical protein
VRGCVRVRVCVRVCVCMGIWLRDIYLATEKVEKDVSEALEIVSAPLLQTQVCVYRCITCRTCKVSK